MVYIIVAVFACVSLLVLLLVVTLSYLHVKTEYNHGSEPNIILLLLKATQRIVTRKQGCLYGTLEQACGGCLDNRGDTFVKADKSERIKIKNCRIDGDKLQEYRMVCGYKDGVPLCFLESLFMKSLILLVTKPEFKLSPLGLIHIRQSITVHDDLSRLMDDNFDLESNVKGYRVVSKGVEVEIRLAVIDSRGFCVWDGQVTLLSRNPKSQRSGGMKNTEKNDHGNDNTGSSSREVHVLGDTGIRYAHASGDWNPHHLYEWSARLLGYRKPIAHGMWILSTTLSLIGSEQEMAHLPITVNAEFKRPLFMPTDVKIKHSKNQISSSRRETNFIVTDSITSAPHVLGNIISNIL